MIRSPFQGTVPDVTELIIGDDTISRSRTARNLGVVFDQHLNMEAQVSSVCSTAFLHLREISEIRDALDNETAKLMVQSLVISRLDYCNSLLFGLPSTQLDRLQRVQNAAAKVVARTERLDHATPVRQELHWLPVVYRIQFKILKLTYCALHGLAPQYIAEMLVPYIPTRMLRTSDKQLLVVPRSRLRSYGDRSFAWAAPTLWNNLPLTIRSSENIASFSKSLKTHLFIQAYNL